LRASNLGIFSATATCRLGLYGFWPRENTAGRKSAV